MILSDLRVPLVWLLVVGAAAGTVKLTSFLGGISLFAALKLVMGWLAALGLTGLVTVAVLLLWNRAMYRLPGLWAESRWKFPDPPARSGSVQRPG